MSIFKKIIVLVFLFSLKNFIFACNDSKFSSSDSYIKNSKNSVFQVMCQRGIRGDLPIGTATLISEEGLLITARHIFDLSGSCSSYYIRYMEDNKYKILDVNYINIGDTNVDIDFLKINDNRYFSENFNSIPIRLTDKILLDDMWIPNIEDYKNVKFRGYDIDNYNIEEPFHSEVVETKIEKVGLCDQKYILLNSTFTAHGYSGSLIVDHQGYGIGILHGTTKDMNLSISENDSYHCSNLRDNYNLPIVTPIFSVKDRLLSLSSYTNVNDIYRRYKDGSLSSNYIANHMSLSVLLMFLKISNDEWTLPNITLDNKEFLSRVLGNCNYVDATTRRKIIRYTSVQIEQGNVIALDLFSNLYRISSKESNMRVAMVRKKIPFVPPTYSSVTYSTNSIDDGQWGTIHTIKVPVSDSYATRNLEIKEALNQDMQYVQAETIKKSINLAYYKLFISDKTDENIRKKLISKIEEFSKDRTDEEKLKIRNMCNKLPSCTNVITETKPSW